MERIIIAIVGGFVALAVQEMVRRARKPDQRDIEAGIVETLERAVTGERAS